MAKRKNKRGWKQRLLKNPKYCPNVLLNFIAHRLGVEMDSQLARKLGCTPVALCKVRHRVEPVGDMMLLRMHEATDMRTLDLKQLAGMI